MDCLSPIDVAASSADRLRSLCRRFHVRRLDLFGSATEPRFNPDRSDVDLVVDFEEMPPAVYAEAYFGLRGGLAELFERDIDLVIDRAVANPYLRRRIETQRRRLYPEP